MAESEQRDAGPAPRPPDEGTTVPPPEGAVGQERGANPPRAWRLTYAYDASGIRLVAQQRVATIPPPDDSDLTESARAGYWVEVRDAAGEALYRQVLTNTFRMTAEVHSAEPGRRPTHVPTVTPEGAFQVLVPDLPDAHDIVLHGLTGPGEPTPGEPTTAEAHREAEAETAARGKRRRQPKAEPATARPLLTERLVETPPFGAP